MFGSGEPGRPGPQQIVSRSPRLGPAPEGDGAGTALAHDIRCTSPPVAHGGAGGGATRLAINMRRDGHCGLVVPVCG